VSAPCMMHNDVCISMQPHQAEHHDLIEICAQRRERIPMIGS